MPQGEVHLISRSANRRDLLDRAEGREQQRQRVGADVPESTPLPSPLRPAERIPRLEDRREHENASPVPAVTVDFGPEPGAGSRIKATCEEDDGRSAHGLDDPVGRLDRQRERLLEQQRPPRCGRAHGQLCLDVRRNRERNRVDSPDQVVDVGERLRAEPSRQRRRLGPIPAPDADQIHLRMRREPRRMHRRGPVAGTDQAEPHDNPVALAESAMSVTTPMRRRSSLDDASGMHILIKFRRRAATPSRPPDAAFTDQDRASGEEAAFTREQEQAEATPSHMNRLKTDRI